MKKFVIATMTVCSLSLLSGCSEESKPADPSAQGTASESVTLPVALFTESAPADATSLVDAKTGSSAGQRVVFEAKVGGREAPFVENRAVFFVADTSLASCDEEEGDGCKTPWDYCCESPESLLKHMATVRVVDDAGQPLKVSIENQNGLKALTKIIVVGTVEQVDEEGNFVINAESIHVRVD